eukprot:2639053-Prymnesium_polylepis.2
MRHSHPPKLPGHPHMQHPPTRARRANLVSPTAQVLKEHCYLDAILTVVDCKHVHTQLAEARAGTTGASGRRVHLGINEVCELHAQTCSAKRPALLPPLFWPTRTCGHLLPLTCAPTDPPPAACAPPLAGICTDGLLSAPHVCSPRFAPLAGPPPAAPALSPARNRSAPPAPARPHQVAQQISFADRVLLNKVDIVTADELEATRAL